MTKQVVNLGASPNGAGGDDRRSAWVKARANFTELYNWLANLSQTDDQSTALPAVLPIAKGGTGSSTGAPTVGIGQTWKTVTGSRALNTTYTNNTGRPIQVTALLGPTSGANVTAAVGVDGELMYGNYSSAAGGYIATPTVIVGVGASYSVSAQNGSAALVNWKEIRA